jgi:hypothetical protein
MVTSLKLRTFDIHGMHNDSKARLLVCLYCYRYWIHHPGLTVVELVGASKNKLRYLQLRLPVFAGCSKYPPTGRRWNKPQLLANRSTGERRNRPVFLYSISAYARHVVEDKMSRELFWHYVELLGLTKYAPKV